MEQGLFTKIDTRIMSITPTKRIHNFNFNEKSL